MILFTADWHLKLGQKNVPLPWACTRFDLFFEQIRTLELGADMHVIGGDLFDRVPSMDELTLYFDFIKDVTIPTYIYDGNHEATRKNKTFFSNLKRATQNVNDLVTIVDKTTEFEWVREQAASMSQDLTKAYETLSDRSSRERYDATLI